MTSTSHLTEDQASRLAAFLTAPARPEGTMSYPSLAGFLFAIACAPETVPAPEWMNMVFDDQDAHFESEAEENEILQLIFSLYRQINEGVQQGTPDVPPDLSVNWDAMANLENGAPLNQWALGFARGHAWLQEAWEDYTTKDVEDEVTASVMTLSFFASRKLAEAVLQELGSDSRTLEQLAAEVLQMFPHAMVSYAQLGRR